METYPEVELTNFGPIAKGKFKIKPLTVFVGPNNAGKTYAATLAHSILSSYGDSGNPWAVNAWVRSQIKSPAFQPTLETINQIIKKTNEEHVVIPLECTREVYSSALKYFQQILKDNIQRDFGSNLEELVRIGSDEAKIKMEHGGSMELVITKGNGITFSSSQIEMQYTIKNNAGTIAINEIKNEHVPRKIIDSIKERNEKGWSVLTEMLKEQDLGTRAISTLMMRVIQSITSGIGSSLYLPAERSGILATHKIIMSSIMKNASYGGTTPFQIEQFTGAVSDFITALIYTTERKQHIDQNGGSMIKDIFGGQLTVEENKVGLPNIIYRFKNTDIPLHRTSSGISEIAPFPIFFQNYVNHGDVLIIEEPEAHLHPSNQIKLANHIIRNIKKKEASVIVITHSTFVLEQLSLLVKMSQLTSEQRKKHGDDPEDYIDDINVAPHLFKESPSGDYTIVEIEHSPEIGIAQDEFIKVTERAYNKDVRVEQALEKE